MDRVKAAVAAQVRHHIYSDIIPALRVALNVEKDGDIEWATVSDLMTQIRIRTDQGPRYFLVQVKEQI